ncbi:TetR/AcrR family transcriptional regulator [Leeuwenhoekiella polynyae]|uniref:TetR family transcriptional regulator n=1 Tax=Leeuwenhoekiella polynyae TaxID=1550906 RepID=A0A4Q0NXL8_9FLAO|nr:TetR/AcrR family transcriptional regulator [Leeuwenhoekiella polynyae]RXG16379.1 TetR family transcriptional regulator [Leeuwenhoekiella polynyae]
MKTEILKNASQLFLNQGFKSVTMDDIATHMGISKKTIYANYAHKIELVHAVGYELLNNVQCGVQNLLTEHMNPIEELYEIKKYVIQHLQGEKTSSIQQLIKYYPKIFEELRSKQYEFMRGCMERNITRGIEQGLFRENLDVEFISRMYQIGITNIKDQTIFPTEKFPHAGLYEMYLEYHLRGIVTPEGRKILNHLIHSNQD